MTKPRILLDACIPQDFRFAIRGFDVATARFAGLAHLANGRLLDAAAKNFEVLVTVDGSLAHQQNMTGRTLSVVVMQAASNRMSQLQN